VQPKWWLSGVNLIDLDADGKLDLFLRRMEPARRSPFWR
jgi:hypothetical protein